MLQDNKQAVTLCVIQCGHTIHRRACPMSVLFLHSKHGHFCKIAVLYWQTVLHLILQQFLAALLSRFSVMPAHGQMHIPCKPLLSCCLHNALLDKLVQCHAALAMGKHLNCHAQMLGLQRLQLLSHTSLCYPDSYSGCIRIHQGFDKHAESRALADSVLHCRPISPGQTCAR